MGIRFDLGSSSVIAYLMSQRATAPRLTYEALDGFVGSLSEDHDPARPRLISTSHDWLIAIRAQARQAREELHRICPVHEWDEIVDPSITERVLRPLAAVLGQYDVYILPVGTWRDSDVLDRFAHEAARVPGHGIMVLIPDYYNGSQNARVLDPNEGVQDALKSRDLWPGAIFLLGNGQSTFLPLEDAHSRLVELVEIMGNYGRGISRAERLERAWRVLSSPSSMAHQTTRRRLLHLSDLHFGTQRAAETQMYLQTALRRKLQSVDRIVITGDLFDQPARRHAQQFRNFSNQLQMLSGRKPIVVPGNHDQRILGNSILGLGRRLRELADLEWDIFYDDPESRIAFFCFDSSRTEDLARGRVDREQLLRMATRFEIENQDDHLSGYLRVALIHHHPYPYLPHRETPIIDPRRWGGREEFVELRGAREFLAWCAGREIGLILHGHKHIPRLINDYVAASEEGKDYHNLTTVGCGSSLGANDKPLSFNVIEWRPESQSWSVDFQIDRGDGQGFRSAAIEAQPIGTP